MITENGMQIENNIFQRMNPNADSLIKYGFRKTEQGYCYNETFHNGEFRADILISEAGIVSGKIIDQASGDEYSLVRIENAVGTFIGEIREEYTALLMRIADACFDKELFLYPQSNRLAKLMKEKYGEEPDFPFSKLPGYGVFRYSKNGKWYGLVMNIKMSLLKGEEKRKDTDDDAIVEVLNVRAQPEQIPELIMLPGFYPSYHMNHKTWLTVLLDGTVADEKIAELLDYSRSVAGANTKKQS